MFTCVFSFSYPELDESFEGIPSDYTKSFSSRLFSTCVLKKPVRPFGVDPEEEKMFQEGKEEDDALSRSLMKICGRPVPFFCFFFFCFGFWLL